MLSIVSVVVLLGILIFAHELGHFLVAKWAGVGVLKFSLGFGPRLIGKKRGETEYLISLIPLGGYVKLLGESAEEKLTPEDERRSFLKQPVYKRMGIVIAGPLFNVLLAWIIFALVNMAGIPVLTAEVGGIQEGSAAAAAGLRAGDRIVAIDDVGVTKWDDISPIVLGSNGRELTLKVERGKDLLNIKVIPKRIVTANIFGEQVSGYRIGITPSNNMMKERFGPLAAVVKGLYQTWTVGKMTVISIYKMIQGVVSPKGLGGPILIAQIAGAQVKEGVIPFLLFMALLSVNLAVLNLLPIPILDGGHLCFYMVELLTGKEIDLRWREMAQQVGFFLLVLLMLFVFIVDLERLNIKFINEIIHRITG